ncbi:hypothetical protein CICLE_v10026724mg [Citrus x clementina]|uniref:Uncharacterized protein n=3 Tax=Citrus TaxID=2706 RepID=A0A067EVX4_CITSI|nr:extensin [Citrus x clementina]XP_006493467.2 formin-like protein 13 [Citrus sinensis]ESR40909.1 hypothetical protein CICLE_v10026724mg [Citrus x clementina]KDO55362.1 hypothetical protein CISIN_1g032314mg [Citrus sinensis]GAY32287.1 hypothetical protein CUMW_281140 [Citrus unshiu]
MMSTTALLLTLSLAFLVIAAHARPLSSGDLGRPVNRRPPPPKAAPPIRPIASNLHNDKPSPPESQLKATNSPDNGKIKKRSPPPPPAASKSPTHSENTASPCVAANPCGGSSFIAMVTDELARPKHLPPPRPKVAPPTYIMME